MDKIGQYIESLLFNHNCVILPGFGGFVANYKNAAVNKLQGKFTPPSKMISFNKNLVNNDGLLVNYIAIREGLSYNESLDVLTNELNRAKRKLAEGTKLPIKPLGILFFDNNNNIRFEPSLEKNLLLDSFGLSQFNLQKIAKPIVVESELKDNVIPMPLADEVEPVFSENNYKKKVIPLLKKIAYAAALIPFIAYLFWLPLETEILKGGSFIYADLNPFTSKICPQYKVRKQQLNTVNNFENQNEMAAKLSSLNDETIEFYLFSENDASYRVDLPIFVNNSCEKAERESTFVKTAVQKIFKFHIIAGCFKEYKNADRLVNKLRKKGFNAAIVDKKNLLYRVCFESFSDKKEAKAVLEKIKKEHNLSAWLLIK